MTSEDIPRIRELLEFLVRQRVAESIIKLNSDEKKVYNLSGEKGQVEMARMTGFSAGKVSKIWQNLESKGLLVRKGKGYKKVI